MSKSAPALIQLAIALVGALTVLKGPITLAAALQLVPLAGNALLVYVVPLFGPAMRSGWKTGVAVAVALAAAAIPFAVAHHITGGQAVVVIFAGLQALGAHIGVQIRKTERPAAVVLTAAPTDAVVPSGIEPTNTTMIKAVAATGGEFVGEAAR